MVDHLSSTKEGMKVSVLVVTYNHENYLADALESVLAQDVDFPIEIVIAEDCSTDASAEIIENYHVRYPNLFRKLENTSNLGITRNYERGFAECTGEYVAVIEGDDVWLNKNRLKLMVSFLDNHPECSFVFNRILFRDDEVPFCRPLQWDTQQSYELKTGAELAYQNFIGNFSACVYRSTTIPAQGDSVYSVKMYDWLFNLSVSRYGLIGYLPQVLSVYRQHNSGSWSSNDLETNLSQTLSLIPEYDALLKGVYNAQFSAHANQLKLEIEIAKNQRLKQRHKRNPVVAVYILVLKVIRRLKMMLQRFSRV